MINNVLKLEFTNIKIIKDKKINTIKKQAFNKIKIKKKKISKVIIYISNIL